MQKTKLALIGFGHAARAFSRMLIGEGVELAREFKTRYSVVGISTRSRGSLVNEEGIDLTRALLQMEGQNRFLPENPDYSDWNSFQIIKETQADVIVELTTLNVNNGQPAIDHIKAALERGKHVITANKGPLVFAYEQLRDLAQKNKRRFLFEGTVMDGAPIFSFVQKTLPGVKVSGFRGILNSTSNFILQAMERGYNYDQAIEEAQKQGFAEADPSMDLEGWDAAAKTTVLLNVLMGAQWTIHDVDRTGITGLKLDDLKKARNEQKVIKLICEGGFKDGAFYGRVGPQAIPAYDPLANINGTTSALTLQTNLMGELTITEHDPEVQQTAYGILSDLLRLAN